MPEEDDLTFRGIRPGEEVVMYSKQHPWLLMPIGYCWLIAILLGGVALYFFGASKISSITIAALVVFAIIYTVYQLFLWNNGVYIITSQRVIKIDQNSMFNRVISEAEIDRIQEISSDVAGPIRTMLNFGTVHIKTASSAGRMDLDDVSSPYDTQQEIVRRQRMLMGQNKKADVLR